MRLRLRAAVAPACIVISACLPSGGDVALQVSEPFIGNGTAASPLGLRDGAVVGGIGEAQHLAIFTAPGLIAASGVVQDAEGRIGVGTIQPNALLELATRKEAAELQLTAPLFTAVNFINTDPGLTHWKLTTGNNKVGDGNSLTIWDDTNSAPRLTINQKGMVGIGTPDPQAWIHLHKGDDGTGRYALGLRVDRASPEGDKQYAVYSAVGGGARIVSTVVGGAGSFTFASSSDGINETEHLRIDGSGNVGIGTSAPRERLVVNGRMTIHPSGNALPDCGVGDDRGKIWVCDSNAGGCPNLGCPSHTGLYNDHVYVCLRYDSAGMTDKFQWSCIK